MGGQAFAEADLSTIEPGKLHVAFNGDMPMTSLNDGQLVGTDGEMISRIASRPGLEIVPEQMDWAAAIELHRSPDASISCWAPWAGPRSAAK